MFNCTKGPPGNEPIDCLTGEPGNTQIPGIKKALWESDSFGTKVLLRIGEKFWKRFWTHNQEGI
jgi:hypothetical protein